MAKFGAISSAMFWALMGVLSFAGGVFLAVTIYPSRLFSGEFYVDLQHWLAMDIFLGHLSPGLIETLLLLTPALLIIQSVTMFAVMAQLLRYGVQGQPVTAIGTGIAFNISYAILLLLLVIHLGGAVPAWVSYAREQVQNRENVSVVTMPDGDTVESTTSELVNVVPPFLNVVLPEPIELLNEYEQRLLPVVQISLLGLVLALIILTTILFTSNPRVPRGFIPVRLSEEVQST